MIAVFILSLSSAWFFSGCASAPKPPINEPANYSNIMPTKEPYKTSSPLRYVALGDSYTIGFDVKANESWPSLLVNQLQSAGIAVELVDNLAISGYTAKDVIEEQLPVFATLQPQFATILVGANDLSLGVSVREFQEQFAQILDEMLNILEDKSQLVVLTIPDFTQTPRGRRSFSNERYATLIENFNRIIDEEAAKRDLPLVELQNINDEIGSEDSYFTGDGLHPSAKQYELWADRIFPDVKELFHKGD
jgi:lysophospholipase L1-like esterase